MSFNKFYHAIITLNPTQIYSIFASLGTIFMNSVILFNAFSYHRSGFFTTLVSVVYSGIYLFTSVIAIWGALIGLKKLLFGQIICALIYIVLTPFVPYALYISRDLDFSFAIAFICLVPLIAMYCEIAKDDMEQNDGIRKTPFSGLDTTKDLDYGKIPTDVQKKYLAEQF